MHNHPRETKGLMGERTFEWICLTTCAAVITLEELAKILREVSEEALKRLEWAVSKIKEQKGDDEN